MSDLLKLHACMRRILGNTPVPRNVFLRFEHHVVDARLGKKRVKKLMIGFPSLGCAHALSLCGPCTMCSYAENSSFKSKIDENKLVAFVATALHTHRKAKPAIVELLSCGSFFNTGETPLRVSERILDLIASNTYCKKVIVETRPKYVTKKKLARVLTRLGDRTLEVRFGLESANDFVRNYCINKNTSKKDYEKAFKVMQLFPQVIPFTYCLIKPPFLNEAEAITDAVATAEYAFSKGVRTVSLKPLEVHDHTLVGVLFKKKLFKPPWLWSVIEVLRQSRKQGEIIIGSITHSSNFELLPHNCPKCTNKVLKALRKYTVTQSFKELESLTCACKKEWAKEVAICEISAPPGKKAFDTFFE